jgi:hypothetical protein
MKKAIWEPLTLWGWPSTKGGEKRLMRFRRRQGGERSKYMPHQGKQEMIRREIQENRRIFGKDFHFSKIQYTTIMANLKAANQSEGERKYG